MKRIIKTTGKQYHCGETMVLHATSSKGQDDCRQGAIFKERQGYHCSSIVEAAIRAAAKGRYNSHGDLREGFQ